MVQSSSARAAPTAALSAIGSSKMAGSGDGRPSSSTGRCVILNGISLIGQSRPRWKHTLTSFAISCVCVCVCVCVPRDRSDGRRSGVTTEPQRWESRVTRWGSWAQQRGMAVEFVWWGTSELLDLLSQDAQAGRLRFWFGGGQFSDEWFDQHLQLAISAAGPRYTPEVHVDMPLVRDS